MKRYLASLALLPLLFSCGGKEATAPSDPISFADSSLTLQEGESKQLSVSKPESLKNYLVFYSVANTSIASIDGDGLLTALKEGNTVVLAKCGASKASLSLTVTSYEPDALLSLSVPEEATLEAGDVYAPSVSARLGDKVLSAEEYSLAAISSDESVCLWQDGAAHALKAGSATLSFTLSYRSSTAMASMKVNVI